MEKQNSTKLEGNVFINKDEANQNQNPRNDPSRTDSTTSPAEEDWEYVTGSKLAVVIIACTVSGFIMLLDLSIVATAIPRITSDFHALSDIGWYGTAYQLANCAFQPLNGRIYNQFNSKYTFIFFLGLFELGSLLCGIAVSSKMLIIGRAVAGMGGAGIMNGALTIIRACIPTSKLAAMQGIMMGTSQLGVVAGPLIGGVITQYLSWRWCFYINLPAGGLVLFAICFIRIPDRRPKHEIKTGTYPILQSFDLLGFVVFASAAIMFLLAIQWGGNQYRWSSATVVGLICGSAAALAVFLFWEHKRGNTAMIPLFIFKERIVWTSFVTYLFLCSNVVVSSFYLAIYFQAVRGKSPSMSGVFILPSIISMMILGVASGIAVGRFGYYLPWAIGSGVITSIGTGLLATFDPNTPAVKWIFYQIIAGVGRGCGLQMPLLAVQTNLKPELVSSGVSILLFMQGFGPSIFLSLAQTVFDTTLRHDLSQLVPGVDPNIVFALGAADIRKFFQGANLGAVIQSFDKGVNNVFYLLTGAAVAAFVACWGMGWKRVHKEKETAVVPDV